MKEGEAAVPPMCVLSIPDLGCPVLDDEEIEATLIEEEPVVDTLVGGLVAWPSPRGLGRDTGFSQDQWITVSRCGRWWSMRSRFVRR